MTGKVPICFLKRSHLVVINIWLARSDVMRIQFVKIWANAGLFSVYFCPFHTTIQLQIEKSVYGVLGIRTRRGRKMVGADETTELWWPPYNLI